MDFVESPDVASQVRHIWAPKAQKFSESFHQIAHKVPSATYLNVRMIILGKPNFFEPKLAKVIFDQDGVDQDVTQLSSEIFEPTSFSIP